MRKAWERFCFVMAKIHERLAKWADKVGLWNNAKAWLWKERADE